MSTLTKEQLLGLIDFAQSELEKINKVQEVNKPIKGKKTIAYYCPSAPIKKWKVEFMGNHIRWCLSKEEVISFINTIESPNP